MNGGYVTVDCKGLNLLGGSTPQVKSGLYKALKDALASGKEILACNCIYGNGHPCSPISLLVQQESSTQIVGTASILQVWVTNEDSVTIVSLLDNVSNAKVSTKSSK